MKKTYLGKKGFTLIEILIVVVIIAILAALIIPRFLNQPERAVISEGQQMLGAIKRAQLQHLDLGANAIQAALTTAADWQAIGMTVPPAGNFTYACNAAVPAEASTCTAIRTAGNAFQNSQIGVTLNTTAWACGPAAAVAPGTRVYVADADPTRGCIPG